MYDYAWQTARPIYDKNSSGKIYPDNAISGMEYDGCLNFEIEKDAYGRVVKKSYSRSNESEFLSISYEYYNKPEETGTRLTNLVKKQITRVKGKAVQAFYYYYDINGNIGTVEHSDYPESIETQDFGVTVENYEYDGMNQLVREDNRFFDETVLCTYDNSGNILTKKEYVHDAETPTELLSQKNYSYPSTGWKDKLTSVNNQPIIYDVLGNPLCYLGHTLTWDKVRQLKTFDNNTFSYNSEGIRTKKNDIDYIYHNGKLFIEQRGFDNRIIYYYDESGIAGFTLLTVNYDEYGNFNGLDTSKYVFEKNLQGDVIGIYNDLGRLVAQYRYDAWGNCIITENVGGMATFNAIRYRGYYYDTETGLYYLKSRYYDPNTGRFISADIYLTSGNILGYNVYAYCLNNPISLCDPSGKTPVSIRDFVESRGGVARCSYYGFAFYELNDIGLVVGDKPFLDYAIDFYIENGVFMAEDYELAYYFKVDDWATYFPGFRWYDGSKGDEAEKGFEVKTIGKFSNKDFCLDFAQCIIDMVGENGKYLGRNAKEIAQECFAHYVLKCLFKIPTSIRSTWFDTYYRSSEEIGYIERDGNSWAYPVLWFLF